tara:strand:- start:426 stop:1040 length:615 start_codon:yes stop_codon:yes gene_type:complete
LVPIKAGSALNRRHVERNFLNAARKLNNLHGANIARNSLGNANFKKDAFQEIWWNRTRKLTLDDYHVPDSPHSPNVLILADAAGDGDFNLRWSLNLEKVNPYSIAGILKRVTCVPFAGDQILWSGADYIDHYFTHVYNFSTAAWDYTQGPGDSHPQSMSGECTFSSTGNFSVGLMFAKGVTASAWTDVDCDVLDLDITLTRSVR